MFSELFNNWQPEVAAVSTLLIGWSIVVLLFIAKFIGLSDYQNLRRRE